MNGNKYLTKLHGYSFCLISKNSDGGEGDGAELLTEGKSPKSLV